MNNKIKYANNFTFDEPCDYKGIKIYPIKLRDYLFFNFVVECLLIDKNSIPDVEVISMSYLDFIVSKADDNNKNIEKLLSLLYLCTKTSIESIKIYRDEKKHVHIYMSGVDISSSDFDEIKDIIIEQNLIEIPDFTIQKEIRDKIDEGKKIRSRMNNHKFASLEDQIISLSMASGVSMEQIYEMTYRKFVKSISRMDLLIHYKIYLQSSLSGMVEFKDKSFIKHWLREIESNENRDMVEVDTMKRKMNFEDKK